MRVPGRLVRGLNTHGGNWRVGGGGVGRRVSMHAEEASAADSSSTTPDHPAPPPPHADGRRPSTRPRPAPVATLSPAQQSANAGLADRLRGAVILAPLTRVGTLPFRALCADFGAPVTLSEMAFARPLARGDRVERARLRRDPGERCYGFQMTTNNVGDGLAAARLAAEEGIDFLDLNAGCPIHEATRRGLGAALLRNTRKLATLVSGIASDSPLPLTVKIRTGLSAGSINVDATVAALAAAGAAAVTVHGRTQEQRYKRAADWGAIARVAAANPGLAVIGNGDVLTHWEVAARLGGGSPVAGLMVGRGALEKPWLWKEVADGATWLPSAEERVAVLRAFMGRMQAYLGHDAKGWHKAQHFLPAHFDFFCRWRPLPDAVYGPGGSHYDPSTPLLNRRRDLADPVLGETPETLSPLERLLRCPDPGAHAALAAVLWEARSDAEAVSAANAAARDGLAAWEAAAQAADRDVREGGDREGGDDEREGRGGDGGGGRRRSDDSMAGG